MNPSTLYFAKGWNVVQLALILAMGAAALWLLLESGLFAEPAPPPPFSTDFSADHDLFQHYEKLRAAQPRQLHGIDRLTDGWFTAVILFACLAMAAWEIGFKLWRIFTREPALVLQSGQLVPHPSFVTAPTSLPLNSIHDIVFDRTDRVRPVGIVADLSAFSWAGRLGLKTGGRFRHTLLIDYATESGERKFFRIGDSDVEGGVKQLGRFATYLMQSRRLGI